MRKVLLSIISLFAMATCATLNAQNQVWWGHYDGETERSLDGTKKVESYNVATLIPGDNSVVAGKTLKGVRLYLRELTGISDLKLWLSNELPESADAANVMKMDIDLATLTGGDENGGGLPNDIMLPTPYEFKGENIYVGYSFEVVDKTTQGAKQPVVLCKADAVENGCMLKTSKSATQWMSREGNLAVEFLLEGSIYENAVTPSDYGLQAIGISHVKDIPVTVTNLGSEGISDIDVTFTSNGTTSEEKHIALETPFKKYGHTLAVYVPFEAAPEVGTNDVELTVTKVNGKANEAEKKSAMGTIDTRFKLFETNFIVEEFTGTGCGYCPRGIMAMEKLRELYGNHFIGIAIHQYNTGDAMYYPEYPDLGFSGAPSSKINRGAAEVDPDTPSFFNIAEESFNTERRAGIEIWGEWAEDHKSIDATVVVETLDDGANYKLFYAIIADGLTGEGSAWTQSNYYSSYGSMGYPYIEDFVAGGVYGQSNVSGLVFNDVAIGSSGYTLIPVNDVKVSAPTVAKQNVKLTTNQNVLNALIDEKVAVAVAMFDSSNNFVNARKYYMGSHIDSRIATVKEQGTTSEVARYTVDGQRLDAPAKGINLVRMSDGTTRKVIVK